MGCDARHRTPASVMSWTVGVAGSRETGVDALRPDAPSSTSAPPYALAERPAYSRAASYLPLASTGARCTRIPRHTCVRSPTPCFDVPLHYSPHDAPISTATLHCPDCGRNTRRASHPTSPSPSQPRHPARNPGLHGCPPVQATSPPTSALILFNEARGSLASSRPPGFS